MGNPSISASRKTNKKTTPAIAATAAKSTARAAESNELYDLMQKMDNRAENDSSRLDMLSNSLNAFVVQFAPKNIVTKWRLAFDNGAVTGWIYNAMLLGALVGGNWLLVDKIISKAGDVDA